MSVVLLGSTSGSVTLQEPAVAGSTVIDLPATSGMMAVLPTATSVLPQASGGTGTTTGYYGFKNRIINGAMVIDQRNAGASVTPANSYTLDRWISTNSQASKFTVQQNAGSVTPPAGFANYLGVTSSSAYSVLTGDYFAMYQPIEGFNVADLACGTASAATVTLSFWVRSSLTGTFAGSLRNGTAARSYPFTYTISSANTWEQKSVTIAGDTSGTWATNNTSGMSVAFGLGAGATFSGTAGTWASGNYISATGATSVVGTNGATFYITGVQLEKGSTATSFDYRPYGTELALCQRYYWKRQDGSTNTPFCTSHNFTTTDARGAISYSEMRTSPVISFSTASNFAVQSFSAQPVATAISANSATPTGAYIIATTSGLTGGQGSAIFRIAGTAYIDASAEL